MSFRSTRCLTRLSTTEITSSPSAAGCYTTDLSLKDDAERGDDGARSVAR
jgi:hypothetical protein